MKRTSIKTEKLFGLSIYKKHVAFGALEYTRTLLIKSIYFMKICLGKTIQYSILANPSIFGPNLRVREASPIGVIPTTKG